MELWQSLPEEARATAVIGLLGLGFLLALYVLGRLLTWRRPRSALPGLLVIAGALALLGGISIYLDRQPTLPGVVEAKTETIDVDDDGGWSSVLRVRVRYTPPEQNAPRSNELSADAAVYDRLSVGDPVDVRHLHLGGWLQFSRLSDRSTLSILFGLWPQLLPLLFLVGLMGLLWWVVSATGHKRLVVPLFLVMVAFVLLINSVPQWQAVRPLVGEQATAVATVRAIIRFTEVGGTDETQPEQLVQPFDLVQVEFIPEEWHDPVMAADMVDAGSLSLTVGAPVTVHYLLDQPRTLRLEEGTRSYAWKNTLSSIAGMAFLLLVLLAVLFAGRIFRRMRRPGSQTSDF